MATRGIKGILARNSWDFYEYSTAWAFTSATLPTTGGVFALLNNGMQQANLDVYRTEFSISAATVFYWAAIQFSAPIPAGVGLNSSIHACETNQPQPLGWVDVYTTTWWNSQKIIKVRYDPTTTDAVMIQSGGPFITLAPGWGLALFTTGTLPSSPNGSFTAWYQVIMDQISQVR